MRLTSPRRSSLVGSAAVAAMAVLALATTASATPDLVSGDDRAVAFDGNVDVKHKDACTVGGLTGTPIAGKITFTGGVDKQDLDITAVAAGVTVTGVVVKGGDAYNVYLAAKLGATPPWNDLRSPDNNGGNVPAISHWYACGIVAEEPPGEEKSDPEQPANQQPVSSSVTPPSATTSSSVAAAPAGAEQALAATGFGSAWLVGLGAALVAAGAAVLLVLRRRRA